LIGYKENYDTSYTVEYGNALQTPI